MSDVKIQVTPEQCEKLLKSGAITEETYKLISKKFAGGGVVTSSPSIQTDPNPLQNVIDPVPGIDQSLQNEIQEAKMNTQVQAEKSPFSFISDDQWAAMPPEQKLLAQDPALAQNALPSTLSTGIAAVKDKIGNVVQENAQRQNEVLKSSGLAQTSEEPQGDAFEQAGLLKNEQAMTPQVAAPAPNPTKGIASTYDKGFNQVASGITKEAEAGAELAASTAAAYTTAMDEVKNWQQKQEVLNQQRQDRIKEQNNILQQKIDDYTKSSTVDPNRYWANKTTGEKITAAIGIFLGGLGRHGGNDALQIVQNAINRDIDAQKAAAVAKKDAIGLQNNIYQNMLSQFQDERSAEEATRLAMLNLTELRLKQQEALFKSPMIKAKAEQGIGALQVQKAQVQAELLKAYQNSPNMLAADEITQQILKLPASMQSEAFKELGEYRGIEANLSQLNRVYDQISSTNTLSEYTTSPLQTKSRLEKAEADLFPIVKSIVGEKMTDADARILIKSQLPKLIDNDKTIAMKKADLVSALQSKIAERAPRLTGLGIIKTPKALDLKRNK